MCTGYKEVFVCECKCKNTQGLKTRHAIRKKLCILKEKYLPSETQGVSELARRRPDDITSKECWRGVQSEGSSCLSHWEKETKFTPAMKRIQLWFAGWTRFSAQSSAEVSALRMSVVGLSVSLGDISWHVTCIIVFLHSLNLEKHHLQPLRFVSDIPSKCIGSGTILAQRSPAARPWAKLRGVGGNLTTPISHVQWTARTHPSCSFFLQEQHIPNPRECVIALIERSNKTSAGNREVRQNMWKSTLV